MECPIYVVRAIGAQDEDRGVGTVERLKDTILCSPFPSADASICLEDERMLIVPLHNLMWVDRCCLGSITPFDTSTYKQSRGADMS